MFCRMLATVFALSLLTSILADFLSVNEKGWNGKLAFSPNYEYEISAGQSSGRLDFPKHFNCENEYTNSYPPALLRVEVRDDGGSAEIVLHKDLKKVEIYRSGPSASSAKVSVHISCTRYAEEEQKLGSSNNENVVKLLPSAGMHIIRVL